MESGLEPLTPVTDGEDQSGAASRKSVRTTSNMEANIVVQENGEGVTKAGMKESEITNTGTGQTQGTPGASLLKAIFDDGQMHLVNGNSNHEAVPSREKERMSTSPAVEDDIVPQSVHETLSCDRTSGSLTPESGRRLKPAKERLPEAKKGESCCRKKKRTERKLTNKLFPDSSSKLKHDTGGEKVPRCLPSTVVDVSTKASTFCENPVWNAIALGTRRAEEERLTNEVRRLTRRRTGVEDGELQALIKKTRKKKRKKRQGNISNFQQVAFYDKKRCRPLKFELSTSEIATDLSILSQTFLDKEILSAEKLCPAETVPEPKQEPSTNVDQKPTLGRPKRAKATRTIVSEGAVVKKKRERRPTTKAATIADSKKMKVDKKDWHINFETHKGRKGWLQCISCQNAIWAPNARKHLRDCKELKISSRN